MSERGYKFRRAASAVRHNIKAIIASAVLLILIIVVVIVGSR